MTAVPSRSERRAIRRQRKQGARTSKPSRESREPRRVLQNVARGPRFDRFKRVPKQSPPSSGSSSPTNQTKFTKGARVHVTTCKESFVEKHGTTGVFTEVLEDGKYQWVSDKSGKSCKSSPANMSVIEETFRVGDKVEARYKSEWFKATITCDNGDKTYALKWENEAFSAPRWRKACIRRSAPSPTPSPLLRAAAAPFVPKQKPLSSRKSRRQAPARQTAFKFPNPTKGLNPNAREFRAESQSPSRSPRNSTLNPLARTWKAPGSSDRTSPNMSLLDRAKSPPLVRSTSA